MIDEKKIKREIDTLLVNEEPQSLQEKLLQGFREYVDGQPIVNIREAYFRQRMMWWLKAAGVNVLMEVE